MLAIADVAASPALATFAPFVVVAFAFALAAVDGPLVFDAPVDSGAGVRAHPAKLTSPARMIDAVRIAAN
ncbi:MAG: hypothetical protein ACREJX_04050 [Polyangiaceae bacterium]